MLKVRLKQLPCCKDSYRRMKLTLVWLKPYTLTEGYFWNLNPDPGPRPRKTWTQKNLDPEKSGPRKTWTLKNLDPGKREPRKPWTLKNLDPEKHGINIGFKNMSDFRELCFIKTMHNVIYNLKVRVLTDI